ncbi:MULTISPECIES: FecR family protein [unclassified Neptuniibacter]|uniref:FecR family protein n=1 Tax=unclassified Neptuniibacter TaxID=2630693 RepID=UPI000C39CFE1|nr:MULTISPECIES: FecR family protein [unclassified Neptuniibacter]MAY43073.1 hypothetical protein [Oceanospirillaceae bacterium]|tara:strand:- start:1886 stop:2569 length:684 start_codon:yes stop_codon:yes gene_type:complete
MSVKLRDTHYRHAQLFIAFVLTVFPVTSWAEGVGKVILTQGHPIVEREGQHLLLKRNDALFIKDTLITSTDSKVLFRLKDRSTISLAENTLFTLTQYDYKEGSEKSISRFNMLKGAFRTLTGKIGKQKEPNFEIHTPVATIGVRGTEFWGGFIFSDSLDVTMLKGKGVYITNEHGTVEISKPGEGTMVSEGQAPSPISVWSQKKLKAAEAATSLRTGSTPSFFDSSY